VKFIFIFIMIFSAQVFACPKLTGKYATCTNTNYSKPVAFDLEITQKVVGKINVYSLTSTDPITKERETETYYANGETVISSETDPETGSVASLSTTVTCFGKELKTQMTLTYDGEIFSQIQTSLTKVGNQIIQRITGFNLGREESTQEIICE